MVSTAVEPELLRAPTWPSLLRVYCQSSRENSPGDKGLSISVFLFPFCIWIRFRFELRTSENETKAVVTVTTGGEESPCVLGNLCLPHDGLHNQDLLRVGDETHCTGKETKTQNGPKPQSGRQRLGWQDLGPPQAYK